MKEILVVIDENCPEFSAYKWTWETFACYAQITYKYVDIEQSEVIIGGKNGVFAYNGHFWNLIRSADFNYFNLLNTEGIVMRNSKDVDLFMTAFYFINCLFERSPEHKKDDLNRSEYNNSIWKLKQIDISTPFVNKIFDQLLVELQLPLPKRKTIVWLSHDIDVMYGALIQDGKWCVKKKKYLSAFKLVFDHFFRKPQWMNLSDIAKIEEEYLLKSTFFMLTEKGRIDSRKTNADYLLSDVKVKKELQYLKDQAIEIGLHKSLSNTSYQIEKAKIGSVSFNRNHYLKIDWPTFLWEQAESEILLDASLGYAEQFGFRNGYSLPFYPFDIDKNTLIPVLEVPLNIMDGTFSYYLKTSPDQAFDLIQSYIKSNENNAIISILWHNSHFTNFKYNGYRDCYLKLLKWFKEEEFEVCTASLIIKQFPISIHYN